MIKIPGYFTGFSSKSDGSASLRFATQEISDQDFAEFKRNLNAFGYLLFQENSISEKDIPTENAEEDGISPAKRLRNVLFVYFKDKKITTDFETWYKQQMEKFIDSVKQKLE